MTSKTKLIVGTRGSLLATTQCNLIKSEIEKKNEAYSIELKTIKTQGDQITDKPLWQLEGKDFFTKELDAQLIKKKIDLVVHSYKDLGSIRPGEIELTTITQRKYAHDILLIKNSTIEEFANKRTIVIGTSSPRRIINIEKNIRPFLPNVNIDAPIRCKSLRGNVNTRIEKLRSGDFDAIVLAFAGLERLAQTPASKKELKTLLDGLNYMVLPQEFFTSAASQGSLAIETNKDADPEIKTALKSVHCVQTASEIERERKAFNAYGGGCHLAVGVNVTKVQDYYLHRHLGKVDSKEIDFTYLEGVDYTRVKGKTVYFNSGDNDFLISRPSIESEALDSNLFVTSSHCFHNLSSKAHSIWSAGNRTMQRLVRQGYWVNGSAEALGHEQIHILKNSELIKIFTQQKDWQVLSHSNAKSIIGETVPCYSHEINSAVDEEKLAFINGSEAIFWSSKNQFDFYTQAYPELLNKIHLCGLGKTFTALKDEGINVIPCINQKHLKSLI